MWNALYVEFWFDHQPGQTWNEVLHFSPSKTSTIKCHTLNYSTMHATWSRLQVLWRRIEIQNMPILALEHSHLICFNEMTFQRFIGERRFIHFAKYCFSFKEICSYCIPLLVPSKQLSLLLQTWTRLSTVILRKVGRGRKWKVLIDLWCDYRIVIQVWDSVHIKRNFCSKFSNKKDFEKFNQHNCCMQIVFNLLVTETSLQLCVSNVRIIRFEVTRNTDTVS